MCRELYRDYQFGLKLIEKNTGKKECELSATAVEDPDGFLSNLVVTSYGKREGALEEEEDGAGSGS